MRTVSSVTSLLVLAAAAGAQAGQSTFGQARARELAELGRLPTAREVVVRDFVNYHRHRLPLPKVGQDVALDVRFDRAAAGPGDEVWLQIGYTTAPQGDRALAGPTAVALVVDVSGSMADAGKLSAVQAGLRAFVERLRPDDEVALVTFSTEAQVVERLARRGDGRWLHDAIARLTPGGNTNLHAGLMLGLDELARGRAGDGATAGDRGRVLVLTDGIANTGVTAGDQIVADATVRSETTIDISTIGVGQNLDVPLLQRLADGCRGLFHFVADAADVQKVFVAEADALLTAVARDVALSVQLPHGFQVVRVHHDGTRLRDSTLELRLPDLNAGATGVVMVQGRIDPDAGRACHATAELRFRAADSGRTTTARASAGLQLAADSYVVRAGDSLERIAREQLGDPLLAAEIAACNADLHPNRLAVGARLRLPTRPTLDLEVRKNAAVAALAQGLRDMAEACDARRWADADRALRLANDEAQRLFPGQDDDVQKVRDITAGHQGTLRRYVDRFRDH